MPSTNSPGGPTQASVVPRRAAAQGFNMLKELSGYPSGRCLFLIRDQGIEWAAARPSLDQILLAHWCITKKRRLQEVRGTDGKNVSLDLLGQAEDWPQCQRPVGMTRNGRNPCHGGDKHIRISRRQI